MIFIFESEGDELVDKYDTVLQLAVAMGQSSAVMSKHTPSRYDAGTKTLYSNGIVATPVVISDALEYFDDLKHTTKREPGMEMYSVYAEIASQAIKWMMASPRDLGG